MIPLCAVRQSPTNTNSHLQNKHPYDVSNLVNVDESFHYVVERFIDIGPWDGSDVLTELIIQAGAFTE